MPLPKSLHAAHDTPIALRDADAISPSLHSRQAHALAIVGVVAALAAGIGVNVIDDPRPLDVQLGTALQRAGGTLQGWQAQLARGLHVSLRAVADGRDLPPVSDAVVARAVAASGPLANAR